MRNIKLVVEYEGTDYHGFAIQRGLRTVQGELERAVAIVTAAPTRVTGSGRTDAGAHALGQVVSFRTATRLPARDLKRALNAVLPDDLIVALAEEVEENFDARRSARRRHYRYSVWNAELPAVRERRYRLHVAGQLDLGAMNAAAENIVGTRDFACFTFGVTRYLALGRARTTIRTIFEAWWHGQGEAVDFEIVGTAFLPHMIRNMVGSMLRVGLGKLTAEEFRGLIESESPGLSAQTVPAHGLMLVSVEY